MYIPEGRFLNVLISEEGKVYVRHVRASEPPSCFEGDISVASVSVTLKFEFWFGGSCLGF